MAAVDHHRPKSPSLRLLPFRKEDCDWLVPWISTREALYTWSGNAVFRHPLDKKQMRRHLKMTLSKYPGYHYYKAVDFFTGEPAGYGEIARVNSNRSAFLARILIGPEHRGRGLGVELVRGLLEIAFRKFRLHRVELNVFTTNRAAIQCYESAGLVREGLLRDVLYTGGEYWSEYRMSILEHEWRRLVL